MRVASPVSVLAVMVLLHPAIVKADAFCEAAGTDCRAKLLTYVNRETVRLDIGMEEMTDSLIADAVIARYHAHVPVRLIVEPRRNSAEPANGVILGKLKAAGLPMRYKRTGDIIHWKTMILAGQNTVEFSAAQYTRSYLVPVQPYLNFKAVPRRTPSEFGIRNSEFGMREPIPNSEF